MKDPQGLAEGLSRYAEAIRHSPHNLLSPKGLSELESRHFPESLTFARSLPGPGRVLDVGSGGGLPGIVIALARPDLEVHLLDATGKKVEFLVEIAAALNLLVTVHHGRAEELASSSLAGTFDVVTARAVAPLVRLVPWCAPFLREGGTLHAIKGERWADELAEAEGAISAQGLAVLRAPDGTTEHGPSDEPRVVVLGRPTGTMSVA